MDGVNQSNEFVIAIVSGTVIFLLFSAFIIAYIIIYKRKRSKHFQELIAIKAQFNEELLKSQIEIQEQTFDYISQEIHDNVGQLLSVANVQINIANQLNPSGNEILSDVKENINKAMTDLRNLAKSLSSERIRLHGIYETVAIEAANINKSGIVKINTSTHGVEQPVNEHKKLILFRIIQECLHNSIKHAVASEINIDFYYHLDTLQVSITDNGKGFDSNEVFNDSRGLGLMNIKNRASLTGGTSMIESELNKGTAVTIKIPYE